MSKLTIQRGAGSVGGAGGASLDAVTAAVADQAGILNADWNIAWKWAKVTNTEVAMEITESSAATNGTSTSGVPNQVLAKFSTLATSTMSPLSVYSRAAHVFSVSPTTAQVLGTNGTAAAPFISFCGGATTGIFAPFDNNVSVSISGTETLRVGAGRVRTVAGTAAAPSFGQIPDASTGIFFPDATTVSVSTNGTERMRVSTTQVSVGVAGTAALPSLSWIGDLNTGWSNPAADTIVGSVGGIEQISFGSGAIQVSKGTADAVSYAINARKARGTVASPTVITTGDDLLTISGSGYVGATNTYQEACRITFDSTGTISDSATGIAGTIDFLTADTGSEPTSKFTISNKGELLVAGSAGTSGQILTSGGSGAAPSWATAGGGFDPTTTVEIMEEFIGGVNTTGQMFTHGWRFTGSGSIIGLQGIANKPGILQLGSGTTAAAGTTVELRNIESNGLFVGGQGNLTAIYSAATPVSHADATYRIGLSGQGSSAGENESQILFRAIGTGNWYAVTSSGAGTTTTDTGVAQSTSYKQFKTVMNSAGTSVVFYIDGTSVATHTTHIPTGNLVPKVQVQTASTTAYYIYADYFYVKITGLSR